MSLSDLVPVAGLATTAFIAGLLWVFSACVMSALSEVPSQHGLYS